MYLKADIESIAASAQVLSSAADTLDVDMDALAAASRTMRARWMGDAQTAWTGRHAQIDGTLRDKATTLRLTSRRVSQYAQELAQADVDGARAVLGL
ncbi:WXG100 family type VII secretion target [Microbacterium sp. SORGH_AS_0888]|uniref:WXG100 family type VII secretion target n=1 Tax=Microbacterium sp. SORGH_AS_0888 TaxID=3041791 RepID=UPI002781E161|nr:WXG100 family type VII secretion target [Microbacterium sp. SORGH_AS_0888]MDQ1128821.1 WXG100 family type VII secretion target [Microbacterium sp. SORGH_AS_0888]